MTQKEKIKRVEKLYDELVKLFPNNSIRLGIHGIDMAELPEGWKLNSVPYQDGSGMFLTAERIGKSVIDITLFS